MGVDKIIRAEIIECSDVAGNHPPIALVLKGFDFLDSCVVGHAIPGDGLQESVLRFMLRPYRMGLSDATHECRQH